MPGLGVMALIALQGGVLPLFDTLTSALRAQPHLKNGQATLQGPHLLADTITQTVLPRVSNFETASSKGVATSLVATQKGVCWTVSLWKRSVLSGGQANAAAAMPNSVTRLIQ